MKIDRAGYPFIAGALVPAARLWPLTRRTRLGRSRSPLLGGFFAYFFRDPERPVPTDPGIWWCRRPTAG